MACWWVVCTKPVRLVGRGGGGVGEIIKFHKSTWKKNVQDKMWKHQKTYKQSENVVSNPPKKWRCYLMSLSRQVHIPEHKHTQIRGLGFLVKIHSLQNINYLSASLLQSSYHTCTYVHSVLIKNWSASCCVSLLCWGIHYLCHALLSRADTNTQLSMETNRCSTGRQRDGAILKTRNRKETREKHRRRFFKWEQNRD